MFCLTTTTWPLTNACGEVWGNGGVKRGTIAVITPPRGSLSTTRFAAVSTVIIIKNRGKGDGIIFLVLYLDELQLIWSLLVVK